MVARRQCLGLAFDAEQARDKVFEVRCERDEKLGFRFPGGRIASCLNKFFPKIRIEKRQKGVIETHEAVALVEIAKNKTETKLHRESDVTGWCTVKIILFEGDPYADKE